jgi:hypothetical protein
VSGIDRESIGRFVSLAADALRGKELADAIARALLAEEIGDGRRARLESLKGLLSAKNTV